MANEEDAVSDCKGESLRAGLWDGYSTFANERLKLEKQLQLPHLGSQVLHFADNHLAQRRECRSQRLNLSLQKLDALCVRVRGVCRLLVALQLRRTARGDRGDIWDGCVRIVQ